MFQKDHNVHAEPVHGISFLYTPVVLQLLTIHLCLPSRSQCGLLPVRGHQTPPTFPLHLERTILDSAHLMAHQLLLLGQAVQPCQEGGGPVADEVTGQEAGAGWSSNGVGTWEMVSWLKAG